jgi:hypothetical protein
MDEREIQAEAGRNPISESNQEQEEDVPTGLFQDAIAVNAGLPLVALA